MARVILLAGASGSGKSYLARRLGVPVLELDHFYRDGDAPGLPQRFGIVDWDDAASWDLPAAQAAIDHLCGEGWAQVPIYDIPTSRRVGGYRLELNGSGVFVAEGIFAAELVTFCRNNALLADALCLNMHPAKTFGRRLARDLVQSRKPPLTLIRRGLGLARGERATVRRWIAQGCRPVSAQEAEAVVRRSQTMAPPA